jgi:uncharacterized protein YndB with AHSA1/START domain
MRASASAVIDRPVEEVYAFVTAVENLDQWVAGVTEPRRTSDGEFGVGATFSSKYTYAGNTHHVSYVVTAHDPPARHAVKATSGPFPFEGILELEPVAGRTKITHTIDAGADGVATQVVFTLCGPLLRVLMRKQLRKELEGLKALLEDGSRSPTDRPSSISEER